MAALDRYDGIIFDFGGVLVLHQTPADQAAMAAIAGIPVEQFSVCYWAPRDLYDEGQLTGTEYWTQIGAKGGVTLTAAQIEELIEFDAATWMAYDEPMWTWLGELRRAGKRLALLSNMPRDLGEILKARTDRFQAFDHVTLSYELRLIKPDAAIYRECLARIGTEANRTLFLDDRSVNIKGAQALGIQGIEFTGRQDVLPKLLS